MKRIGNSVYSYKGYEVNGFEAAEFDWRIVDADGEWVISLPSKGACKDWIDAQV